MKQIFIKNYKINSHTINQDKQLDLLIPGILIDDFNDIAASHSKSIGYSLKALFKEGYGWILLSWNIKIDFLPQLKQKIIIETWISQIRRSFAYREFLIKDSDNQVLVKASSLWLFYHIQKKRVAKIPSGLSDQFKIYPQKGCPSSISISSLLKQPIYQNIESIFQVQKENIDILDHVHNSTYIDWMIKAKPEPMIRQYQLCQLQIIYHHEIKYPGKIMVKSQFMSSSKVPEQLIYDAIWDKKEQRLSAEIVTKWQNKTHKNFLD